jgi:hypothetical protein
MSLIIEMKVIMVKEVLDTLISHRSLSWIWTLKKPEAARLAAEGAHEKTPNCSKPTAGLMKIFIRCCKCISVQVLFLQT